MKSILEKAKQFELMKLLQKILLFTLAFLIVDALIAFLGGPYLRRNVAMFLLRSDVLILSDLLFFEGAVIFALGSFIAFGRSALEIRRYPKKPKEASAYIQTSQVNVKRIHKDIAMIIIGALLLVLSLIFGIISG